MTKKTLKWRLSEKPSADNIRQLVKDGILTKEEAKQIILDDGEYSTNDLEALKNEVDLLRKLVLELSTKIGHTEILKIIEREIPVYIERYKWPTPYYQPYITWCSSTTGNTYSMTGSNLTIS